MYLSRIYDHIGAYLTQGKVLVIFGARQVGKTTLIEHYLQQCKLKYRYETGDNIQMKSLLSVPNLLTLQEFASGFQLLVIDEAQKIKNIGETLKLMIDKIDHLQIIVTGSSSFELAGQVGEPLTGRKTTLTLYPISQLELLRIHNAYDLKQQLPAYLIYGSYPEIVAANQITQKRDYIMEIMQSYLLKDILELDKIRNSKILLDVLRMLAFQIGKEVSLSEIGTAIGIDYKTVARYLDLLEKSYVIHNLRGFSKNLRKEVTKKSKYYFYDVGIRNAIIANFNPLELRNDVGELWENFIVMERLKKQAYHKIISNNYFWRTWDQQEIDWVEEREGKLFAYEFKFKESRIKIPSEWKNSYPEAEFNVVTSDNYLDFIT